MKSVRMKKMHLPAAAGPHVSHQNENVVVDFQMHKHPEMKGIRMQCAVNPSALQEGYIPTCRSQEAEGLMWEPRGVLKWSCSHPNKRLSA